MKVFVAGSTGALGVPLVEALVVAGHEVIGPTRSQAKRPLLESLGAQAVIGDVLDETRMKGLLAEAAPDGVVQILNALPEGGPRTAWSIRCSKRHGRDVWRGSFCVWGCSTVPPPALRGLP